jgi:hypothetical protein
MNVRLPNRSRNKLKRKSNRRLQLADTRHGTPVMAARNLSMVVNSVLTAQHATTSVSVKDATERTRITCTSLIDKRFLTRIVPHKIPKN